MRRKHKTSVLDIKQSKDVIIANRVHMNQIENMVVFLPIFWVATIYGPIKIVGMIGVIWFLSRVAYAYMYMKSPNKREKPFIVGVICIVILAVLGLYWLVF